MRAFIPALAMALFVFSAADANAQQAGQGTSPLDVYEQVRADFKNRARDKEIAALGLAPDDVPMDETVPGASNSETVATGIGVDLATGCHNGNVMLSLHVTDDRPTQTVVLAAFADRKKNFPLLLEIVKPTKDAPATLNLGPNFANASMVFTVAADGQKDPFEVEKTFSCGQGGY